MLFLQIDALAHDTARRAVRDGSMPTLAAWLRSGSHTMTSWHTDWSSQTGAAVSGILHGSNHDILGFRWYEKDRDHITRVSHPVDAAEVERRHSDGRGLLAGDGASRGNLFTGDAAHISLTMSSLSHVVPAGSRRQRRTRDRVGSGYYAYFASPVNALRTIGVSAVDILRELAAAARERRDDVRPRVSRGGIYPLARPGVTVISRDVVVYALLEDMLAGRPVAYADFLGYDEAAHHGGLERADSLAVLHSIDQQIGRLYRASALAPREYHLVVLSDHGQTQGWAFTDRFGESIEELVGRLCGSTAEPRKRHLTGPKDSRRTTEGWQVTAALGESAGPIARRLRHRAERAQDARHDHDLAPGEAGEVPRVAPGVVCVVSGHTAMVSFADLPGRVSLEEIERHWPDLLPGLVDHDGVGFLLVHSDELRAGRARPGGTAPAGVRSGHRRGPAAALRRARRRPGRPRLVVPALRGRVINSRYDPDTDEASAFEPHVGSHGGLGGPQQLGFLTYPRGWAPPGEIVGAEQLHRVLRGWLTDLGHPEPTGDGAVIGEESPTALQSPAPAAAAPEFHGAGRPPAPRAGGTDRMRDHGAGPLGATRRRSNSTPAGGVCRSRPGGDRARTRTRTGRRSPGRRSSRRRAQRRTRSPRCTGTSPPLADHRGLHGRVDAGRVGEQLLGEPERPAAQRVHHVVGEVDGEPAGPEHLDHRVQVRQHDRRRHGAGFDQPRRPGVTQECATCGEDPLPQRGPPVGAGDRRIDLADDDVDQPVQQLVLVRDVLVQRHRDDAEILAELAHADRVDPAGVGERHGGTQHPLPAERHAAHDVLPLSHDLIPSEH